MNYDSLIILGPTASGKTDISIRLAHKLGSQIVNADSMYIYKNFDIGTAKPTNQEMQNIKHYLVLNIFLFIYSFSGILSKLASAEPFLSLRF